MSEDTDLSKIKFTVNGEEIKPMDSSFTCGVMEEERHPNITFKEALEILGIVEYGDRIFSSNSHGELFHLQSYINLSIFINSIKDSKEREDVIDAFKRNFAIVVDYANSNWERPASIYQHAVEEVCRNIM